VGACRWRTAPPGSRRISKTGSPIFEPGIDDCQKPQNVQVEFRGGTCPRRIKRVRASQLTPDHEVDGFRDGLSELTAFCSSLAPAECPDALTDSRDVPCKGQGIRWRVAY
jgi:hypothetical protein